ncbi:MAG: transposase [Victivallales bacterium]|nr:transposase [Victivallales bacterium]
MARRARNLQSESFIHITQQCEWQKFLFESEEMREYYLWLLKEVIAKFGLLVLGYCIMKNHIHLLVKVGADVTRVSRAMQSLAGRMAQHFNRVNGIKGHFWRDRFSSTHIGTSSHFKNVISYIDANALNHQQGMDPIHWKYCSYHELQNCDAEVSIVDRALLVNTLKMQSIKEFLDWQRKLMERQQGRRAIVAASHSVKYSGHFALGTQNEIRLLKQRLRKRGQYSYSRYLGLDHEGDPLWSLDLCSQTYAIWYERRQSSGSESTASIVDANLYPREKVK